MMPELTRVAYIAAEDTTDLAPTLLSLQEQGFLFNAPEEMASWFRQADIPFRAQSFGTVLEDLSQSSHEGSEWIFIVGSDAASELHWKAQQEALVTYLVTLRQSNILLLTHPSQYKLLRPEILEDNHQWTLVSRQLLQDIRPQQLLTLQKTNSPGDIQRPLYSANPAWIEAIEIMPGPDNTPLSRAQYKNVLVGTQYLVQLARTMGIHPHQAILLQHGLPVHLACEAESISRAVDLVLFEQDSSLTPGGTLVTSEALPLDTLRRVAQAGIWTVVSPQWDPVLVAEIGSLLTPVMFNLDRLQLSQAQLLPMNANSALYQNLGIDSRQLSWQTKQRPDEAQLVDLEVALALAEGLSECAAVIVHQQRALVIASGMVHPMEAVDYALSRTSGETLGAVAVISGEVFADHLFNALIQARIAGALFLNADEFPQKVVESLKKLPFFVGTYSETGLGEILQQVGVRHG